MLDALSLDQLRTFIAAADSGSFSAASRQLRRAQSAVSDLVSRLEGQMGVRLFDRTGRYPKLTSAGVVLLADARRIVADIDLMRARAKGMAAGIEPELSVVVDVMFPIAAITEAARDFRRAFAGTPLRIHVEVLGNTYQLILDRRASLGIVGPLPLMPSSLSSEALAGVPMVMVAAPEHELATLQGVIPRTEVAKHTQLVLTDRSSLSEGREFFVLSLSSWRLADLYAKRAFLLAGLGWGGMPRHAVEADIESGRLSVLSIKDIPTDALVRPMSAAYLTAAPPGPAGRWFIDRLKQCSAAQNAVAEAAG